MIEPARGVLVAQRYELLRPLAKGGMGSVWVARHRDLDAEVTIKFMGANLIASPEARMRFEREARVVARLDSQHVVHVQDYGVENDTPYLVMELLKGESLADRLSREGTLSAASAGTILLQMCKALRTAHDAGLVHRDLKPGNVFLARKDEEEVVKVLDFGIAKSTELGDATGGTETGVLMGSVHYMSPEQIRSSRGVDHRSDLWSIGVILYRALGGRLPFPGDKMGDVLVRVCTDPVPPVSRLVPDLPPGIDGFFARALERDPDRRFQSASEMAAAFGAMMIEATAPPAPPPIPAAQPAWLAPRPAVPLAPSPASPFAPPSQSGPAPRPAPAPQAAPAYPSGPVPAPTAPIYPGAAGGPGPWTPAGPMPGGPMPTAPASAATVAWRPPVAAPAAPPVAAPAAPPAGAPAAPPGAVEAPSGITVLSTAAPPRGALRASIVLAALVPVALLAVVVVLLRSPSRGPASEEHATAPSASVVVAPQATSAPAPRADPPAPTATAAEQDPPPAESASASAGPASASPLQPTTGETPKPPPQGSAHRPAAPAGKPGCNPPYRIDARGVRVPKMECL